MFDFYIGVRTGLSASGVAAIQSLTAPPGRCLRGQRGNDSLARATDFANASLATLCGPVGRYGGGADHKLAVAGDLTTKADR